jgi:hypothetical protein
MERSKKYYFATALFLKEGTVEMLLQTIPGSESKDKPPPLTPWNSLLIQNLTVSRIV